MDMTMGMLEKRIRILHNEFTSKIREKFHGPMGEVEFLQAVSKTVWLNTRKDATFDEFVEINELLHSTGWEFSEADDLKSELAYEISTIKELYFDKGLEGNDLEFIRRYADARGVVGTVCKYLKFQYDLHDKELAERLKQKHEYEAQATEANRDAVRRYINGETVKFGLVVFAGSWILMNGCGTWWGILLFSMFLGFLGGCSVSQGIMLTEKLELVKIKVGAFWSGAIGVMVVVGVSIMTRLAC